MADLDRSLSYAESDPSDLGGRIRNMPQQCEAAWRQGMAVSYPAGWASSKSVTICGMGGSAIAGDLLAGLVASANGPVVQVVRGHEFPFRVEPQNLIVVCSYSGDTQETISLFEQAKAAGARIIVASGGGFLTKEATHEGIPLLKVDLPGEPRSAVGYNLMLLAASLTRLGMWSIPQSEVNDSFEALAHQANHLAEDRPTRSNEAKDLALKVREKLVVVYGGGLFAGLARRWKTQLNENSKIWAWHEEIPELLHNSVEAYASHPHIKEVLTAVVLRPDLKDDPAAAHYEVTEKMLTNNSIPMHIVQPPQGIPPLGQLLATMIMGDYVSYYLAILSGSDPSPTPNIVMGKQILGRLSEGRHQSAD